MSVPHLQDDVRSLLPIVLDSGFTEAGPSADPGFYLVGRLTMGGVPHHLQLFRMRWRAGVQETDRLPGIDYHGMDDMPDDVFNATYMDGPWNTVMVRAVEYAVVITPAHDGAPRAEDGVG